MMFLDNVDFKKDTIKLDARTLMGLQQLISDIGERHPSLAEVDKKNLNGIRTNITKYRSMFDSQYKKIRRLAREANIPVDR